IFVAGNIVWYRILAPIAKSLRHDLRVDSVVRESSDTVSVYIKGKSLEKLHGKAGQFYMLRVMTKSQWWRPHPFSISAAPNSEYVRFTVGKRGDDTALMQSLKPGTRVILEGPYGIFTEERRTREKVVLVASGIGVPPVRALAESMASRPGDITVIYRARNEQDAALLDELRHIALVRNINLHVVAGPRANGHSWLNADPQGRTEQVRLLEMAPQIKDSDVYICGPEAWTHSVKKSMAHAGVPDRQIHSEEYAW
ncbi:MAG: oxidoreductase, partial [Micrococcales bacterium]